METLDRSGHERKESEYCHGKQQRKARSNKGRSKKSVTLQRQANKADEDGNDLRLSHVFWDYSERRQVRQEWGLRGEPLSLMFIFLTYF